MTNKGDDHEHGDEYAGHYWCVGCEKWVWWSDFVGIGGHRRHD